MINNNTKYDVTWTHPSFDGHEHQLQLCNKLYNGIDTTQELLNKLNNEYEDLFDIRKTESTLDNFIKRIVKSITGKITEKPLEYEGMSPAEMDHVYNSMSLDKLAKDLVETAILNGIGYVILDAPVAGGEPYMDLIDRRQLTNWKLSDTGLFTMAVIKETYQVEVGQFGFEVKEQYRVIDETGNVQIWRNSDVGKSTWEMVEEIVTDYNFCPVFSLIIEQTPPLYDVAKINAKHFNFTSLRDRFVKASLDPILFAKGIGFEHDSADNTTTMENPQIVLGVDQLMSTDNVEGDIKWVEVDGTNYEVASAHLKDMEDSISSIALKLQSNASYATTATEAAMQNSESDSRLASIAIDLEETLNKVLEGWYSINRINSGKGSVVVTYTTDREFIEEQTTTEE